MHVHALSAAVFEREKLGRGRSRVPVSIFDECGVTNARGVRRDQSAKRTQNLRTISPSASPTSERACAERAFAATKPGGRALTRNESVRDASPRVDCSSLRAAPPRSPPVDVPWRSSRFARKKPWAVPSEKAYPMVAKDIFYTEHA